MVTIEEILRTQRESDPDATAILGLGRQPLSFGRLFHHVETATDTLNTMGIGRNDRVAIVLPNGPEMATAFLTVAACATSAPLNPNYRAPEFEFYLRDLQAKALIIAADMSSPAIEVAEALSVPIIRRIPLDDEPAGLFELQCEVKAYAEQSGFARPEDVALVLHTSGTTSRPKIVPLTQTNICTSAANIRRTLALTPNDRCLNVMPLFHIHGLMGASLSSISSGASLVCTPGFDQLRFFAWLAEFKPTWYSAVPTMHQAVLAEADEHGDVVAQANLRFIRSSSSSLPPQVMSEVEKLFEAPVIESYGMTEASHQMASNPLPPGERKPGSVGTAAGPRIAIMDEGGKFLAATKIGEIVIQGPNVTPGYENNPEANADAFTDGWFRTGDQGYIDEEGYLFITGRLKEIVNRGGEKIAPREVDEALLGHPAVIQATAFAVPHRSLGEDLAAAVILDPVAASVSEKELRDFAFDRLADFKVPSQIIVVDEIPKGATGKLQRIGLAEKLREKLKPEYVAPRNDLESDLAELWSKALRVERVGVRDNYFGLGGDSLIAAQLFQKMENRFGKRMPLATLFQAPTVEQLAHVFENDAWQNAWSSLVPIQPEGDKPPVYFVHGHEGNVVGYHDLARRLGSDQPFYGLQSRGLDGESIEPRRIEEMADDYVNEIRRIQPSGPYFLGGFCMGGVIAYEMAGRLIGQGEEVALLAMVNARHPDYPKAKRAAWAQPILRFSNRMEMEFDALREVDTGSRFKHLRARARNLSHRIRRQLARVCHAAVAPFKVNLPQSRAYKLNALYAMHTQAFHQYRPRPYAGNIVICYSKQPRGIKPDETLGWGDLLQGDVTIYAVPGFQLGMLDEPRVQIVAGHLQKHLAPG